MTSFPWVWAEGFERGEDLDLNETEARHLNSALRRQRGDRIVVTDGYGQVGEGLIVELSVSHARIRVEQVRIVEPPQNEVEVALGALHTQAMEWAVQKAVEVGVARFRPVMTARSQVGAKALRARLERWRKMVREACKQCHRAWLMDIEDPMMLEELFERWRSGALLAVKDGVDIAKIDPAMPRRLLVGPEGGLNEHEMQAIDTLGWQGLRLGPHVLRAETAVVVGAALLVSE